MNPLFRTALAGIVVAFFALFVVSTFLPPPAAEVQRAEAYFSDAEIATGQQYVFQRRLFFWGSTALELGLLLAFVTTGVARRLADFFARWTGYEAWQPRDPARTRRAMDLMRWLATLLLVGATYAALQQLLQLPLSVGRFYHSVAWAMTKRPFGEWLAEYALAAAIALGAEAIAGMGLYLLLRLFPRTWYLLGTLGATLLAFATALLMPVLIAPLFNTFTPLAQTEWAPLEPRVRQLAERAGIPVEGVYVMDASRQGSHTNAYFTGLGATHRIVLYDTLLKNHPADEVESILAHEIGHWTHRHIIKGILLGALAALVGLILLDRVLGWCIGRPPLYLTGRSDPAGVPLIALLFFLGSWLALPVGNVVSRYFECQADTTSLELAGMPDAFIAAEKRLVKDNKSNVVPAPWNVWLFATHPSALDRIERAEQWKREHGE